MIVNGTFKLMINYKKYKSLQRINQSGVRILRTKFKFVRRNELTSFLHEGKEVIEEFLPLGVITDFVQL